MSHTPTTDAELADLRKQVENRMADAVVGPLIARIDRVEAERAELTTKLHALLYAAREIRMWVENWEMPMDNEPEWAKDYANFDDAIAKATGEA